LLGASPAAAQTYVYLNHSSSSPWTLPSDWPGWGYFACHGNGGAGSARTSSTRGGHGGGGGEFAAEPNLIVTSNPAFSIQLGSSASNTTLTGDSVTLTCHPGSAAVSTGGAGGTGSTNTIHFDGGAGRTTPAANASGGGGGSAGDVVGVGTTATSNIGGGANLTAGGPYQCSAGSNGVAGFEWGSSIGAGSGGCGAASGTANGTTGGQYGGGGSGAADGSAGSTGGAGGDADIVIVYYPKNTGGLALAGPPVIATPSAGTSAAITTTIHYLNDLYIVDIGYCRTGLCAAGTGIAVSSVSDGLGNSCNAVTGAAYTGANGIGAAYYYCISNVATGSDTITVNFASSISLPRLIVSEWLGASPNFAPEVGNGTNGTASTASISTNGATTRGNALIMASAANVSNSITANGQTLIQVPPVGYVNSPSSGTMVSPTEYQIGVTPNTYTSTLTLNNATGKWTFITAAFDPRVCTLAILGAGC